MRTTDNPPIQLLLRSMADLMMDTGQAYARLHEDDRVETFVFHIVASSNIRHVPYTSPTSQMLALPGHDQAKLGLLRPVSVQAVSQSLSIAYETTRIRVQKLLDRGYCDRIDGGVVAPAQVLWTPSFKTAMREVHAKTLASFRELKALGFDFAALAKDIRPAEGVEGPPPAALVTRIVVDQQLRHLETIAPMYGGIMRCMVWSGIMRANLRRLHGSPELSRRYATQDVPPPPELYDPVSIRALALELDLPYETARRYVGSLTELGWVVNVPGQGVIAPASGDGANAPACLMPLFTRMVGDLTRVGFDFEAL